MTGDFNHDDKLDIVATRNDNQFLLYKGNGNGTFQGPTSVVYPAGQTAYGVAAADLNHGDGESRRRNLRPEPRQCLRQSGQRQRDVSKTSSSTPVSRSASQILITDVDGNSAPDLLVSGANDSKVGVLLNRGNETFDLRSRRSSHRLAVA